MTAAPADITLARRELVLVAVILVAFTRLVERSDAFLVVVLLPAVILLAGSAVLRADERPGRPIESLLVQAVLTGGTAAALQLVPAGLGLVPALAAFAFGLDRILALEIRLLEQPDLQGLVLALGDALVALVLGYRVASVRYGSRRDAVRSALTYAIVVAVAAGAIRAMDVPRLVGPAALTLVFYLWDALHATAPARRREPRFLWEAILLAALAVVVVAWNLRLRV